MEIKDVNHISFVVTDINRSIYFYENILGIKLLDVSTRDQGFSQKVTNIQGIKLKIAYLVIKDCKIELIQYTHTSMNFIRQSDDEMFGHLCLNVEGLQEFYESNKLKVQFVCEPLRIPAGVNKNGYMVYLYDLDRNKIELIEKPQ